MATWQEFAEAAPELAQFGFERLAGRVAYLATVRADGSPRVHPLSPHFDKGHLFVYMDPTSPKAHDLRRDDRYALHCSVEDSNGGQGEFALQGRAKSIEDPASRAIFFEASRAAGFHPRDEYVLFELTVEAAFSMVYRGRETVRNRWKAS